MTDEFKPDWVNYRQGLADGRAEALDEIKRLQDECKALREHNEWLTNEIIDIAMTKQKKE